MMDGPRHRSIDRRKQQGMNNLTHTDGQRLLNPSVDRPISRWIQTAPPSTCYVHFCVYTNHISSLFSPTFRDTPTLIHAAHINTHTHRSIMHLIYHFILSKTEDVLPDSWCSFSGWCLQSLETIRTASWMKHSLNRRQRVVTSTQDTEHLGILLAMGLIPFAT